MENGSTLDLAVYKVISGTFGALDSKQPPTEKNVAPSPKLTECFSLADTSSIWGTFGLIYSDQGHFVIIRGILSLCNSKRPLVE